MYKNKTFQLTWSNAKMSFLYHFASVRIVNVIRITISSCMRKRENVDHVLLSFLVIYQLKLRPSWSWSYGSWIYNYLCNQFISPLTLGVRVPFRRGALDTILYDKVCLWLATGQLFSPGTSVSSTNKTDRHDITEILLKVA